MNASSRSRFQQTRPPGRLRRLRLLGISTTGLAVALLVVFHGVLLWQRLADLTVLHPTVALRWLVTPLLLLGLFRLWRSGVSLLWGRKALALWLLVLLLHVSASAPAGGLLEAQPTQRTAGLLLALPATIVVVLLGALATRLRWRQPINRRPAQPTLRMLYRLGPPPASAPQPGWWRPVTCRPPPV